MALILIADDDDLMCDLLKRKIASLGHDAECAYTIREALRRAASESFEAVILDVHMPDGNGLRAIPEFRAMASRPDVIIITGFSDPSGPAAAEKNGAWAYVEKGRRLEDLTNPLLMLLEERQKTRNEQKPPPTLAAFREAHVRDAERAYVQDLLVRYQGNHADASAAAGVSGTEWLDLLRKHGLEA